MKLHNNILIPAAVIAFIAMVTSCTKDLNTVPLDSTITTSASVFNDPAAYKEALAKLYTGLALSGQEGPAGQPDIQGIDEGFSNYIRQYWCAQELPTDEAVIAWSDPGLPDYHTISWSSSNSFVTAMYNRIYYQVSICNEYIREVAPKLDGLSSDLKANVTQYLAEARFLRAFSYWHALDMFGGGVPFVTEKDKVGTFFPPPISKADLFNYIESELKAIDGDLAKPKTNEYARVDQAAEWTLLAKLYLNAEVYIGQPKYTESITYCNQVIASGYKLDPVYQNMFLADNNNSPEIIFPVAFDGIHTQTYGGMNFVIHAQVGGNMSAKSFGLDGPWGGTRVTKSFVQKFPDPSGATDTRAMFFTDGQSLDIGNIKSFNDGYAVTKFKNITSTGIAGSNPGFVDTDCPVFRLADVYLMYAEAVLRGGTSGDAGTALNYVNLVRERAYNGNKAAADIIQGQMTLSFILDERARELYWEGYRRTDLVRYGLLTSGSYLWPWKGGIQNGSSADAKFNVFPIPSADLSANPSLKPTPGY